MSPSETTARIEQIEQQLTELVSRVRPPDEWQSLVDQLKTIVAQAEVSQRKADDEARRANDAKSACEEHATATTQMRGQVEVIVSAVGSLKTHCEDAKRVIDETKSTGEVALRGITDARDSIQNTRTQVEAEMPNLQIYLKSVAASKTAADELENELRQITIKQRELLALTERHEKDAAEALSRAAQSTASSENAAAKTEEAKTAAETGRAAIVRTISDTQAILDDIKIRHDKITEQQGLVAKLSEENVEIRKRLEGVLPWATSAGLATAFREQKKRFRWPQYGWMATFVIAIVALLAIATPDVYLEWKRIFAAVATPVGAAPDLPVTWDSILRSLIRHLPFALPLIWLAYYAGRNYAMAVRMEEDYAYKEALSVSFEGYRREMSAIPNQVPGGGPIMILCGNILAAIAQRPGRIYEGGHQDVTPLTPVVDALQKLLKELKDAKMEQPPKA